MLAFQRVRLYRIISSGGSLQSLRRVHHRASVGAESPPRKELQPPALVSPSGTDNRAVILESVR